MRSIQWMVVAVLLVAGTALADVGMLTQVSGEVSIAEGGVSRAAVPFLKINNGDKLVLGKNGRVQIVYFGNGRQEIWKGAGQLEVGSLESRSMLKPELAQLPPLVVNQLARTPAAGQQGKTGMIRVRSLENPDAAAQLDKQYNDLRKNANAEDTTPEVFLLSGLLELKEYDRAKSVLADLRGKSGYKPVVDHFTPLVNAAAGNK